MIKDKTTIKERTERSKIKDSKFMQMVNSIAYKTDGELWLKNLNRNCLAKIINSDDFEVEQI